MADLEHSIPLNTESVIEAGSVSKQFTAAAILLLEQQGKLSINEDVRKYVPELPDYGTTITLQQMMQHTSGLKDWGSIASISGWPRTTKTYSNDDALYIIKRQKTLNHKPGDEYLYSNSNYNLFAIIVERVSGMSLAEFTRVQIFEPAGMKHTEWRNNFKKVVRNRAIAYEKSSGVYFTDMPNEYVYGNGGLLTTAEDLVAWNNYYLNGKLGNPSLLPKQLTTSPLNNGQMGNYGAGLVIDSVRGWKAISHNGATASYRSSLTYFPDLNLSIAWLSNTSEFEMVQNAADAVTNLLVKDISVQNKNINPTQFDVPLEKLNSYAGWYKDSRSGGSVKLFVKDGKLNNSRGGNLVAVSETVFMLGQNKVEILPAKPARLRLMSRADTIYFNAVDSAKLDEKSIQEYVGEYYSDEAEARYYILAKDGKLIAHRDPKSDYELTPTYKDGFNSQAAGVNFERDGNNKIVSMKISVGRARNVEFRKIAR
jgi:CubicO group peptidase (beta-lactamase class C family)